MKTPPLTASASTVVIIDVQDRLFSAMSEERRADVLRASTVLLEAARLLGAHVLATEQNPEKLGPTAPQIREKLPSPALAKMTFSALLDPTFEAALTAQARRKIVLVGMETHVCVFQTVRDLCHRGFDVWVPRDGVASRREDHRETGLDLCKGAGATITTMESVVFEWLGRAGSDEFRALSKLIK